MKYVPNKPEHDIITDNECLPKPPKGVCYHEFIKDSGLEGRPINTATIGEEQCAIFTVCTLSQVDTQLRVEMLHTGEYENRLNLG